MPILAGRNLIGKEKLKLASLGTPELLIILVVVLLVFGVGRIGKIGSELGKGISAFRSGLREGQTDLNDEEN
ncbi:MAG: twin-arginine translocase TatA/TatE family subunit [Ardenticatenaceae bacterium]|nr:twin-arginine translocase TatA/TatE family subunit [Ardenticatenaceae bacterium]MCB9443470.1 twin-arginine translocase TatA/TatE family subunit [Ardenticatenaceae bacterium]